MPLEMPARCRTLCLAALVGGVGGFSFAPAGPRGSTSRSGPIVSVESAAPAAAELSLKGAVAAASLPGPRAYKAYDESMEYRTLGTSDLLVSSCCLGTMTWGNQNTDAEAAGQLNLAWERGVNFLDTAECYPVPVRTVLCAMQCPYVMRHAMPLCDAPCDAPGARERGEAGRHGPRHRQVAADQRPRARRGRHRQQCAATGLEPQPSLLQPHKARTPA